MTRRSKNGHQLKIEAHPHRVELPAVDGAAPSPPGDRGKAVRQPVLQLGAAVAALAAGDGVRVRDRGGAGCVQDLGRRARG